MTATIPSPVVVRDASPADAGAIARVEVRAWQAAYQRSLGQEFLNELSAPLRQGAWETALATGDAVVLVEEAGEGVIGVVAVHVEEQVAVIDAVYVDPAHWHQGHGRGLLDAAFARVEDRPWDIAQAWLFLHNAIGRAFLAVLGFRMDGAKRKHATGADEVRLARQRVVPPR
jgi:N-acetylglutamate synthase-like GNAT family acetyltransferase